MWLGSALLDLSIEGWGDEDVDLVKRLKCFEFEIVRAGDHGIFHQAVSWKLCDLGLFEEEEYRYHVGNS